MKTFLGTVLLLVLAAGCANQAGYSPSAMVRGDAGRVELAEILTP